MSFLRDIVKDLREKRLWPVAIGLLVALVAVPLLLSKSTAKVSGVAAVSPGVGNVPGATSAGKALPVVTASVLPSHSRLRGSGRDPFKQQKSAGSSAGTSTTASAAAAAGSASAATGGSSTGASGGSGGSGGSTAQGGSGSSATSPTTSTTTTTTTTPTTTPNPTGLTSTQSYHVTISMTNSAGGLDKIDPFVRLGVLPNQRKPLLVQLGVLKGGRRVLFVVEPGAVLSGPGSCTPGPIDCEIVSLAPNQIEGLSMVSPDGVISVTEFAVTAIKIDRHASRAAADKARRTVSAVGRRLLGRSTSDALSLFQYKLNLGAVVDLRDLTVGGF